MINTELKRDLKTLISKKDVIGVSLGEVSGNSIEIHHMATPVSYTSFVYYGNKEGRDADYKALTDSIK